MHVPDCDEGFLAEFDPACMVGLYHRAGAQWDRPQVRTVAVGQRVFRDSGPLIVTAYLRPAFDWILAAKEKMVAS